MAEKATLTPQEKLKSSFLEFIKTALLRNGEKPEISHLEKDALGNYRAIGKIMVMEQPNIEEPKKKLKSVPISVAWNMNGMCNVAPSGKRESSLNPYDLVITEKI